MKKTAIIALLSVSLLAGLASCEKEQFNREIYNGYVDYQFMVDSVDRTHDWKLTQSGTVAVTVSANASKVQLLTANPYSDSKAEIAAEGQLQGSESLLTLNYTVPIDLQTIYAAAVTGSGEYLGVMPFSVGTEQITLSADLLTGGTLQQKPSYQTMTYLYEVGYPYPDDFDFNDMVLRISKKPGPTQNDVDLTVTFEAAGTDNSFAAAVQLADIRYKDVEQAEIVAGTQMDMGYPLSNRFIKSNNLLQKGNDDQAVIRLFENAHWAFNKKTNKLGGIDMLRFNTSHNDIEDYSATVNPITVTYRITFKDAQQARRFSFDNVDPFIIHVYNGGFWEVHTYGHKFDEVLWKIYNGKSYLFDNHISWSLVIPQSDFRYAVEGICPGSYNSTTGSRFGPYQYYSHWLQNHKLYLDWYRIITQEALLY